jgi:hypothetical protein
MRGERDDKAMREKTPAAHTTLAIAARFCYTLLPASRRKAAFALSKKSLH